MGVKWLYVSRLAVHPVITGAARLFYLRHSIR